MSRGERTVKDAARIFGAQIAAAVFGLVFSAWLARNLVSAELSLWPICTTLASLVEVVAGLGMGNLFPRKVPALLAQERRGEAAAVLRCGLTLAGSGALVLASLIAVAAVPLTQVLLKGEVDARLVQALSVAVLFVVGTKYLQYALYAVQQFGRAASVALVGNIARPSLAVIGYASWGIWGAVIALCLVPFVTFVLSLVWVWPYLRVRGYRELPLPLVREAMPLYAASLVSGGVYRLDYVLVGALTKPEALAAYYVAYKLVEYVWHLHVALLEALTPKLAEQREGRPEDWTRAFRRCSRYLFLGLAPMHVAVAALATPIVSLYAGDKYPTAGPILTVLSFSVLMESIAGLHRAHIRVLAPGSHLLMVDGVGGLSSLTLMALLVGTWRGLGAAFAQLGGGTLQSLIGYALLRKTMRLSYDGNALRLALVGSVVVGAVGLALGALLPSPLAAVVGLVVTPLAYLGVLFRQLAPEDVELVVRVLPVGLRSGARGEAIARGLRSAFCRAQSTGASGC